MGKGVSRGTKGIGLHDGREKGAGGRPTATANHTSNRCVYRHGISVRPERLLIADEGVCVWVHHFALSLFGGWLTLTDDLPALALSRFRVKTMTVMQNIRQIGACNDRCLSSAALHERLLF